MIEVLNQDDFSIIFHLILLAAETEVVNSIVSNVCWEKVKDIIEELSAQ